MINLFKKREINPVGFFITKKGGTGSVIYFVVEKDRDERGYTCWKYYEFDQSVNEEIIEGFHCDKDSFVIKNMPLEILDKARRTYLSEKLKRSIFYTREFDHHYLTDRESQSFENLKNYINLFIEMEKTIGLVNPI